jgi:hypothetical protein
MASKSAYFKHKRKPMTIALQALQLKNMYKGAEVKTFGNSRLWWKGYLQPTPLSKKYHIRLDYKLRERPDVKVIKPILQIYNDERIPHRFSDGTLCLFRYKYFEWDFTMPIAETIIPWSALWLYYYEIWQATGVWLGKGEHPNGKDG